MTVTTETGEIKTYHKVYFTAVMNLKYEGGGFNFCPAASGTDDRLDIITVSELTRLKVLCLQRMAYPFPWNHSGYLHRSHDHQ